MSKFVELANLPKNVKKLILGEAYKDLLDEGLKRLHIEPIYCPLNPYVDARLSGHCDLSVLHTGGNTVFLAPYLKDTDFSRELEAQGMQIHFPSAEQGKSYPKDAQMNLCLLGKSFFYSPKVSDREIVDFLISEDFLPLAVRQGYCRCSVCAVNERSIISSDLGVYQKALANGLDCLLITPGRITLEGFDYGFIGGSSFKISDDKICFTGKLDAHPDKENILNFLKKHLITPVFLTDFPIFDIGSAVPLTEK